MTTILLSAGDASGEAIGAELVATLRARRSATRFVGLGGQAMEQVGVERIADARALAVGGLVELASSIGRIARAYRAMARAVRRERPDLVVLIDSGGFNLPLARKIRALSEVPILYFVAPQIWAWRPARLERLVARTDRIAVLMRFEAEFYASRGVQVDCVGHPILDRAVARPPSADARAVARARLGLAPDARVLALFPGSRRNELARNLAIQLAATRNLVDETDRSAPLEVVMALAPSIDADWARQRALRIAPMLAPCLRFTGTALDAIDAADAALSKPGTITLELMLRGCPMVVAARVHPLTAAVVRRRLKVPFVALPNLLAGEAIVPELLQADARPDRIVQAIAPLLETGDRGAGPPGPRTKSVRSARSPRARQLAAFKRARPALGQPGAIGRVASIVEEMLGTARA